MQSVESVLISIQSLLADPNCSSPANVDAAVQWRSDRTAFENTVKAQVEESKRCAPQDLDISIETHYRVAPPLLSPVHHDSDFWDDGDSGSDDFEHEDHSPLEDESMQIPKIESKSTKESSG